VVEAQAPPDRVADETQSLARVLELERVALVRQRPQGRDSARALELELHGRGEVEYLIAMLRKPAEAVSIVRRLPGLAAGRRRRALRALALPVDVRYPVRRQQELALVAVPKSAPDRPVDEAREARIEALEAQAIVPRIVHETVDARACDDVDG